MTYSLSDKFKVAIKLSHEPAYKIAQKNGVDPTYLSKALNDIIKIKFNDPQIIKIARYLKVPTEQVFTQINN